MLECMQPSFLKPSWAVVFILTPDAKLMLPRGTKVVTPWGLDAGANGVVVRFRKYLHDTIDSQPPLLLMPQSFLSRLPSCTTIG